MCCKYILEVRQLNILAAYFYWVKLAKLIKNNKSKIVNFVENL